MIRIALILLLFGAIPGLNAQNLKKLQINLISGTKLFTDDYEGPQISDAWQLKSGLIAGIEIQHSRIPHFLFRFLHDEHFLVYAFDRDSISPHTNFFNRTAGNFLEVCYKTGKMELGLGHYANFHQDIISFEFPNAINNNKYKKNIALSLGVTSGRANIEFVKLIQYSKLFSVFHPDDQFISIKYRLTNAKPDKESEKTQGLHLFIGSRSFIVNSKVKNGETNAKIGLSYCTGVEYEFNKINTSFLLARDWWIKLNGGSPTRDISGYLSNSTIGIRHYFPRLKDFYLGISYAYITDDNTLFETWRKIDSGSVSKSLYYYNVKGIFFEAGIPVNKNLKIDIRGFTPTRGEKGFILMRQSLGIAYNIL